MCFIRYRPYLNILICEHFTNQIKNRNNMKQRICQSCGMSMPTDDLLGTHGNGCLCTEYCCHCFQKVDIPVWRNRSIATGRG